MNEGSLRREGFTGSTAIAVSVLSGTSPFGITLVYISLHFLNDAENDANLTRAAAWLASWCGKVRRIFYGQQGIELLYGVDDIVLELAGIALFNGVSLACGTYVT